MQKRFRIAILATLILGVSACTLNAGLENTAEVSVNEKIRRFGSILDYVATDYDGAVSHGEITNPQEYSEQLNFLDDAGSVLHQLPPRESSIKWSKQLEMIRAAVQSLEDPIHTATITRALRKDVMAAYGVVVAPTAAPLFDKGHTLYVANCVPCHGETGAGDGPAAKPLNPRPRSFLDEKTMAGMSPVRVFNALTDGVKGTAMASFDVLSSNDRWNLAFFVFTLRQSPEVAASGKGPFLASRLASSPSALADMSDSVMFGEFERRGLTRDESRAALAFARRESVYLQTGAPFDNARRLLAATNSLYRSGDRDSARQQASAAYLTGIEPHEAALAAVDSEAVRHLEDEFLNLRQSITDGVTQAQVEQRVLRIGALLDDADRRLSSSGGVKVALLSAALIVVREGFEAALLVLLLFAIAKRSGLDSSHLRSIHFGWIGALVVGVIVWFISGAILGALGGAGRELLEGCVSLCAAVVLLAVSHFVLARRDAQRRIKALKERLGHTSSPGRRRFILASLSFVAVFREAFEVVLFLRAVMLDAGVTGWIIGVGVAFGVLVVVGLTLLAGHLGQRLRASLVLTTMGTLLCFLAVVLTGKGIRALQEAGILSITPLRAPDLVWMGIFPTTQTMLAQLIVLVAFVAIAGWPLLNDRLKSQNTQLPN